MLLIVTATDFKSENTRIKEIDGETLERDLFNTSLLRLCQTRATFEEWKAGNDDDTIVSYIIIL